MSPIRVIGSGFTGLYAAALLATRGHGVEIWEAEGHDGGLLAPVRLLDRPWDRGSHRIHPEALAALRGPLRTIDWRTRPRAGRIVLGGRSIPYPPTPLGFLRGLGLRAAGRIALDRLLRVRSWDEERVADGPDEGYRRFVVRRAGPTAWARFYAPYAEKVWGVDPDALSRSVARQRVSSEAPWRALNAAMTRGGAFHYPAGGMVDLLSALRDVLSAHRVPVHHGRTFTLDDVIPDHPDAPQVLFTGSLARLVPDAGLAHRGLYLLHLAVQRGDVTPGVDTWYTPGAEPWFGRVSRPAAFSPALADDRADVLCVEIPEGRWGPGVDFLPKIGPLVDQLVGAGVLRRGGPVLDVVQTWVPEVYPLYERGWTARVDRALDALRGTAVRPVGRQGLFLHCNLDACAQMGEQAVRDWEAGASAADWRARAIGWRHVRVRD